MFEILYGKISQKGLKSKQYENLKTGLSYYMNIRKTGLVPEI
jgi:hypothetical protein